MGLLRVYRLINLYFVLSHGYVNIYNEADLFLWPALFLRWLLRWFVDYCYASITDSVERKALLDAL